MNKDYAIMTVEQIVAGKRAVAAHHREQADLPGIPGRLAEMLEAAHHEHEVEALELVLSMAREAKR